MDRTVRVRCHELAPAIGDLDANLGMIDAAVADAMAAGVQLLVLPELATSGYHLTPQEARATALPRTSPVLDGWAAQLADGAVLVLGFCEADGDEVFNSAAVLTRGGVLGVYRKTHLWDSEKEVFTPGAVPAGVLDTPLGPLGTLVCYDLEFPEMPRGLALAGAEIIAVPTNWPLVARPSGERAPEVIQAMAAARASQVAIACCDRRGPERGTAWTQGTVVVGPDGWLRGEKDDLGRLDAVVELAAARTRISTRNDVYGDRRPDLY
ncbi:nitrilase-related carbon-nitrogen hydrolase [Pseudonocardia sichuanensis]